jgi:hypothetical protein
LEINKTFPLLSVLLSTAKEGLQPDDNKSTNTVTTTESKESKSNQFPKTISDNIRPNRIPKQIMPAISQTDEEFNSGIRMTQAL